MQTPPPPPRPVIHRHFASSDAAHPRLGPRQANHFRLRPNSNPTSHPPTHNVRHQNQLRVPNHPHLAIHDLRLRARYRLRQQHSVLRHLRPRALQGASGRGGRRVRVVATAGCSSRRVGAGASGDLHHLLSSVRWTRIHVAPAQGRARCGLCLTFMAMCRRMGEAPAGSWSDVMGHWVVVASRQGRSAWTWGDSLYRLLVDAGRRSPGTQQSYRFWRPRRSSLRMHNLKAPIICRVIIPGRRYRAWTTFPAIPAPKGDPSPVGVPARNQPISRLDPHPSGTRIQGPETLSPLAEDADRGKQGTLLH